MKTLGTIIIFVLLSGTTAYYLAKSVTLERQLSKRTETGGAPTAAPTTLEPTTAPTATPTETSTSSPEPTPESSSVSAPDTILDKERIVSFAQTHRVSEGETLAPIGAQYEIKWERIAEANRLKDPYPLSIGQILIIPKVEAGAVIVDYTLDTDRATAAQRRVAAGEDLWRSDPVLTAQLELGGAYGITAKDSFEEIAKDDTAGSASVRITHLEDGATAEYLVDLTQPMTKGAAGIWAPTKLRPVTD